MKDPIKDPKLPHQPAAEPVPGQATVPPIEPSDASTVTGTAEIDSAAEGVPAGKRVARRQQGGRRRRGGEQHRSEKRAVDKPRGQQGAEVPTEALPKDLVLEQAELVFNASKIKIYDILYNPATERKTDEGEGNEEIPEEEWSYTAKCFEYSKSKLDFNYDAKPPAGAKPGKKQRGRKQHERPYKEIKLIQTADDHAIARRIITEMVADAFNEDMVRIEAEIIAAKAKADAGGKAADVLKVTEHSKDYQGPNPTLEQWLDNRKIELEWLRVDFIREAADWFDTRVGQVETMMHEVTRRTDQPSSIEQRLNALKTNKDFLAQEKNLQADIVMFEGFLTLPLTPGAEKTRQIVQTIVDDAKQKMAKLQTQKGILLDLGVPTSFNKELKKHVPDPENGMIRVERTKRFVKNLLCDYPIAGKFIDEAEKRLVGLSPEEELNFWEGVKELMLAVSDEISEDSKGRDLQIAREQRTAQINRALNLYVRDGNLERLVKIDDRTNPKEGVPQGFGQIVERCRSEAKLIGDLKTELFYVMTKMGYEVRKATQTALRGTSNSKKIEAVKRLNERLEEARSKAFRKLQEIKPETAEMNDETKQALAASNTKATQFKTDLGSRGVRDLKWNRKEDGQKEADRPLLIQLREKMAELMELGTPDDIDLGELRKILFPQPVTEAGKPEENEVVVATPLLEQIKSGKLPEALFAKGDVTAEMLKEMVTKLEVQLDKALQMGVVYEVMIKQLITLQPKELTLQAVQAFADTFEMIVQTCENCKKTFGVEWRKEFGLWQADDKNPKNKRGVANQDYINNLFKEVGAGVGATEALFRAGGDTVLKAALAKAGARDVVIPDDRKDDVLVRLSNAVVDGEFNKVNKAMVEGWLTEEPGGLTEANEEEEFSDPDVILKAILDGTLDPALVTEAYPHEDGKEDITAESIQQNMRDSLQTIEQQSGSAALREAVVAEYFMCTTSESDPSAADNLREIVDKFKGLVEWVEQMQQLFGAGWAEAVGLLESAAEGGTAGEVNKVMLMEFFGRITESYTHFVDQFTMAVGTEGIEKLLGNIDAKPRMALDALGIVPDDQISILMHCKGRDVTSTTALKRIANFLMLGNRKQLKGEALMKSRGLLQTEDGSLQFDGSAIEAVIIDSDWDAI